MVAQRKEKKHSKQQTSSQTH